MPGFRFLTIQVNAGDTGNDIAKVYVDNELLHTGTTWEDFYRENGKRQPPVVDSVSFNADGIAYPANRGKGFLIDNIQAFFQEHAY